MKRSLVLFCALAAVAAAQGTLRIRIGGSIQQKKLVQQVRPVYPPEAKQMGLSGDVLLNAVIDKQGRVESLDVLSGHPLLADAATAAVRQWVYEATLLNGAPVAVETQIHVNFTLAEDSAATQEAQPKLLSKVDPQPQDIAGVVRLRVTIGKDGRIQRVRVLEGKPPLVAAAVDAVRQWVYEPVTGPVLSNLTLTFEK